MYIGIAYYKLHLPGCRSLKEKRKTIKSMIERIRRRLNAAISETDHHDVWGTAGIGVAVVGTSRTQTEKSLELVMIEIEKYSDIDIVEMKSSIISKESIEEW